jgi:hypothetical protein
MESIPLMYHSTGPLSREKETAQSTGIDLTISGRLSSYPVFNNRLIVLNIL